MGSTSEEFVVRRILKAALVVVAGTLMILPGYIRLEVSNRLNFDLVVSQSVSVMLFAVGTLLLIIVLGKNAFEPSS